MEKNGDTQRTRTLRHRSEATGSLLDGLRRRVLFTALNLTAIAAPAVSVVLITRSLRARDVNAILLIMSGYTLLFPLLRALAGRLPMRMTAGTYIALMLVMTAAVQLRGGTSTSSAALQLLIVLLSGLIFGGRGVVIALAANLAGFVIAGVAVVGQHIPPIVQAMWDPMTAGPWVRSGIVLTLFGGAAALAVTYIVDRLEADARTARAALALEQAHNEALRAAEEEKQRAQAALAEAQRVEALGRLAGGVAHDFNNLLTVIMGATEMAELTSPMSDPLRARLGEITRAAQQGAELTRSLLVLGRKDAARVTRVDAVDVLGRLQTSMQRLLPSDVELIVRMPEAGGAEDPARTPLPVLIDAGQLERAMLNLVVNARDAVDARGPGGAQGQVAITATVVTLTADSTELPAGKYASLSVSDNGSGMDAHTRANLFEPFFTTKGVGHGTGIGMALVRSFVAEAGGAVRVDSVPGRGTTVTLYLPLADTEATPTPAEPGGTQPPVPRIAAANQSVLVVEDHGEVLATVESALRNAGYSVTTATDGNRALALVEDLTIPIDLLCIEGVIPGARSLDVIERTRRLRPATRIVVCSGYVDEELLRRGIRTGAFAYLRKPFTAADLVSRVRETLA